VASDYPGIGTEGVHPYLVSEVEGRAALDAVRAAQNLARWRGVTVSDRAAVVGLSQGGHATLAAAAEHATGWASEVDVRAFGVTAPASVFLEQWQAGLAFEGPHMRFHALVVYAWADHYEHDGPTPWNPVVAPQIDEIMGSACLFQPEGATLSERLPSSPQALLSAPFLTAYESGRWGDDFAAFGEAFAANRIIAFDQTAPIGIWQGDADDVVPKSATDGLVDELRAGGMEIEYTVVPGGGHGDTAFGFVAQDERATEQSVAWTLKRLYAAGE
jgi:pimeloyl-ACP methyl ester carboxylesterase